MPTKLILATALLALLQSEVAGAQDSIVLVLPLKKSQQYGPPTHRVYGQLEIHTDGAKDIPDNIILGSTVQWDPLIKNKVPWPQCFEGAKEYCLRLPTKASFDELKKDFEVFKCQVQNTFVSEPPDKGTPVANGPPQPTKTGSTKDSECAKLETPSGQLTLQKQLDALITRLDKMEARLSSLEQPAH